MSNTVLPFASSPALPKTPTRSGWTWVRLTDVARLATGHTPSRRCPEYWNGDIPWLQLPDIRALDGRTVFDTLEYTNALGIEKSAAVLLPEGTVCLSRTASVGFVTVMGRSMATSQDFVNWVCGPQMYPDFLKWLLIACREPIKELGSGAVHQTIYFPTVQAFAVCIPPVAEQKRIASRLTEQLAVVERARAAATARLEAVEALSAAYLREAFGQEAPICAAPMVPVTPTKPAWRWKRLREIARLATGHTPSRREPTWWGGDIQWLQLPDIRAVDGRRVTTTIEQTNHLGIANSSAVLLPAGTVCMSRTASVGFVTIMGCEMATSQDFVNWTCGPELDPDFLMYLLIRCRREIRDLGSGATHHSIYFETVENFSVCIPPVTDQRRIADDIASRLRETEHLREAIRCEFATANVLPTALLREAFQGTE